MSKRQNLNIIYSLLRLRILIFLNLYDVMVETKPPLGTGIRGIKEFSS